MTKKIKMLILAIVIVLIISVATYLEINIKNEDLSLFMMFFLPPIVGIISAFIALKIVYDEKIIKFDNDYEYFRDLIKKYSPSILAMIYKSNNYPRLMMCGLLELEKKGKITIGKDITINDELMVLSKSEEFLLNCIKNNQLTKENDYKYFYLLIDECKNNQLIYQRPVKYIYHGLIKSIIVLALFATLICFIGHIMHSQELNNILMYIGLISIGLYVSYNYYYTVFNKNSKTSSYKLSKKGEEIYYRLKGLSKFLKDFSKLDEKDKIYIKQWDDYLIYSFIFNQNYNIYNELDKFFLND